MSSSQQYNGPQQYFADSKDEKWHAIRPFLNAGFEVSWAKQMSLFNADLLFCLLKPDASLEESYGFKYEIVLVFHMYLKLEPRTFKAINTFMKNDPARGRADTMFYFLASKAKDLEKETSSYLLEYKEERIAIPIPMSELIFPSSDEWVVKNVLQKHYLTLDRFKNTLPLKEDTYFFGRQKELGNLLDSVKQIQNIGLFGLRKTGKTSLLFKFQRAIERDVKRKTLYIDAQSTSVRLRSWNELLLYICKSLYKTITKRLENKFHPADAADNFAESIDEYLKYTESDSLTLIVDEVEWISPNTTPEIHWNSEFSSFWHAIRTYQTQSRKLSVVIAGVNPSMVEQNSFSGFQNPLFGIVSTTYLKGLSSLETSDMIQNIGRVMGLRFRSDAIQYIYLKYAGHPMLTRLACSYTADVEKSKASNFPVQIDADFLKSTSMMRDRELRFYCGHIVSELAQFYPEEYQLLELLATGREIEYRTKARYNSAALHLHKYGIISEGINPRITYEVLRDYVAEENARAENRSTKFYVIPNEQRSGYIKQRIRSIIEDMRTLESIIKEGEHAPLYGVNSFPEADKMQNILVPYDEKSLGAALTPIHRSFIESIDIFAKDKGYKNYFWTLIKISYPMLQDALLRIRVYRNNVQHLELIPNVLTHYNRFIEIDLEGEYIYNEERYWIQFQRSIDELHRALQYELSTSR